MLIVNKINTRYSQIIKRKGLLEKKFVTDTNKSLFDTGTFLTSYLLDQKQINIEQFNSINCSLIGDQLTNIDVIGYDEKIVARYSENFLHSHNLLPLKYEILDSAEIYTVAVADPLDYNAICCAKAIFGENAKIVYTTMDKILSIFAVVHTTSKVQEAIIEYNEEKSSDFLKTTGESEDASVLSAPAVKLVESILKEGIASKSSDIHIEPYENEVRVRNRIDGVLYERTSFDSFLYSAVVTRFKIISGLNITEKRIPQDGRFSITANGEKYDFRLSTLPTVHGEKIVIRILDKSAFSFSLTELGFTPTNIKKVLPALKTPHGIILLTGPTGCGKSTTLYSFIREINTVGVNIVSVEDPVEYSMTGINQVQVNTKVDMTFASALRSILRQDPNVIMIGEIRDEETAHIAIRSAITGHLVLSTLHTNDAPGAVARLQDMGVEPYLVADALVMVIAQRLIRRLCPDCKRKVQTTLSQMKRLGLKKPAEIYEPVGCPACHNTGYRGRTGIHEILTIDNGLREIITKKESGEVIQEYLDAHGFRNLEAECIDAILRGDSSYSELFTVVNETNTTK